MRRPYSTAGRPHVVVVGGGIAGLAAAHRLTRLDPPVAITLVEAEGRPGGKILTERVDGFLIEGGPDSFLSSKPRGVGLCADLGLAEQLRGTIPRRHRAFVLHGDRLHPLPEGLTGLVPTRLGPMLRTGLLSPRGKARLALDYLLPVRRDDDDESLAAFVRRRLGTEVYERLVEPLMAGIYAGDGDRLSLAATFPQLRRGEREHGSLIKGVLAAKRQSIATGAAPPPPFVTPAGGLGELVDALVQHLRVAGVRLGLGTPAAALSVLAEGDEPVHRVILEGGEPLEADAVILATPAFATAELVDDVDPILAATLRAIPYVSSAIITVAFPRSGVPHPLDGHGYVIPRVTGRPILACTWTSAKWSDRAPGGAALFRVFAGRDGQEEALAGSDDDLLALARAELHATLGVTLAPVLARVQRWPRGMPQYTLGHLDRLATIERRLAALPGLVVAGNAYRGVGIPDSIAAGEAAADAAHAWASRRQSAGDGRNGSAAMAGTTRTTG